MIPILWTHFVMLFVTCTTILSPTFASIVGPGDIPFTTSMVLLIPAGSEMISDNVQLYSLCCGGALTLKEGDKTNWDGSTIWLRETFCRLLEDDALAVVCFRCFSPSPKPSPRASPSTRIMAVHMVANSIPRLCFGFGGSVRRKDSDCFPVDEASAS